MKTIKSITSLSVLIILCLFGCSSNQSRNQKNSDYATPGFMERIAFRDFENGWVLKMDIYQDDKNKDEITHVTLTGYNLKYKTIEDYHLNVLDEDNNVTNTINRSLPYLGDNESYNKDFEQIHNFLTDKKFSNPITLDDLNGLETTILDKNIIVEMYNEALVKEKPEAMKYANLPIANCKQEILSNNDIIQISYLLDYRGIGYVNFEYLYADGSYLSDIVNDGQANDDQNNLYQLLENLKETMIIENDWDLEISSDFEKNDNDLKEKLPVLLETTFTKEKQ